MYWIALGMSGIYLILLFLSRKEQADVNMASLLNPFYKMSIYLLKRIWPRFPKMFSSAQVEKDLLQLHPGENGDFLKTVYYAKKAALCLAIVLAGAWFGAAAKFSIRDMFILGEDGVIVRGECREGSKEINIAAEYGKQWMDFQVQVEPRRLTEEEAEVLFDDFMEKVPEYIIGKNVSLQNVTSDLILEDRYEGFPISVEWESGRQDILSNSGHVFGVENAQQAELTLRLEYDGYCRTEKLAVTLGTLVLSEKEQVRQQVEEMLRRSQKESLDQEEWKLPAELQGESIRWKQLVEDNSMLFFAAAMTAVVLIYLFSDRDLHEQIEKRKKNLRKEYPDIVHKLALFVGAGMTIRGAFQRIANEYEAKQKAENRRSPIGEEMLYTCHELKAGVSEGASYEHFGRRTGLQEYIRLSTLLTQNLKRGNRALIERLREEANKAAEEQLLRSRKAGEEAGTKLLIPMVLMLAIVMTVIMIPAFSSM